MIKWFKEWIWAWKTVNLLHNGPGKIDTQSKEIIIERQARKMKDESLGSTR